MRISIDITCPRRHNANIPKNRKKNKRKQNYRGKDCGRRFISGHERTYKGTLSWVKNMIKIMSVGGASIRNIGAMLQISSTTVLKVLISTKYKINRNKVTGKEGPENG
jgi:transposase-like protein